jgi:2-oxoisovalerate dehydrogenase E2 component (dihydrolipoyl transacylase)
VIEMHGEGAVEPPAQEQIEAETPGVEEGATSVSAEKLQSAFASSEVEKPLPQPRVSTALDTSGPKKEAATLASPAVRARAKDLGIDLAQVKAAQGRIRHADLDAFLLYGAGEGYRPAVSGRARPDETVKVIGMRRRIAENMSASKRHIPHFTYVEEIDVTALEAMRADLNAHRGDKPRLTLLPLLIVALCKVLPEFPMMNARYDDEAGVVTRYGAVHLGMATQTEAGLMVPVIRDAQARNIWQLAAEVTRLADAARSGEATSEALSGSTITVTSLGPLGGIVTTPVINRPEVAIIGPNRIVERPVFRGKEVVAAKLMNLSISCDHRVVDGWDAASFVQGVKRLLETPVLLFADQT